MKIVITGANSGIGLAAAVALARKGHAVVLGCRQPDRAEAARRQVAAVATGPPPQIGLVDLADLASVTAFADRLRSAGAGAGIDVLVNNAGVMATPRLSTADGFELQLGTNHLGPFALTLRLWPLLAAAPAGRVVTISSFLAASGRMRFEDLQSDRSYDPWAAYGQSKLAGLLFTRALARRVAADGGPGGGVLAVAAHPGYARTELVANGPGSLAPRSNRVALALGRRLVAQSAAGGARPTVRAATDPGVAAGAYLAPRGPLHLRGRATVIRWPRAARDDEAAERLWAVSEDLTGVRWDERA